MKKIALLSLGGTIAMTKDESGLAQPALDADSLLQAVPGIGQLADLYPESWKNVPSSFLQFADMASLAAKIKELADRGMEGVVITQGTDTLEETSYCLDLIADCTVPVVMTAAQRNPSLPGSDGPMNLYDAVTVAVDDRAKGRGVLVAANSQVHAAREVIKTHTTWVDTFKSPEFGPLGSITNGTTDWMREPTISEVFPVRAMVGPVEVVCLGMGSDSAMLEAAVKRGARGLVVQALGAGHVPPDCLAGIARAIERDIPVVITSRCYGGRLFTDTYGFKGSEKELRRLGAIFGDGLVTSKARVKLVVLLSAGMTTAQIRHHFEKHFYMD